MTVMMTMISGSSGQSKSTPNECLSKSWLFLAVARGFDVALRLCMGLLAFLGGCHVAVSLHLC